MLPLFYIQSCTSLTRSAHHHTFSSNSATFGFRPSLKSEVSPPNCWEEGDASCKGEGLQYFAPTLGAFSPLINSSAYLCYCSELSQAEAIYIWHLQFHCCSQGSEQQQSKVTRTMLTSIWCCLAKLKATNRCICQLNKMTLHWACISLHFGGALNLHRS